MNLFETAQMLAHMQAYDQRTVGEADVIAWQALLVDAPFEDCQEAIRRHYAEETDRVMPAHVRRLVRDIAREREVSPWAAGQYGVPRDEAVPEVPTGERLALSDLPAAVADLVARVRADLPEGSRDVLYPRRAAWEREHRAYLRSKGGEPNPLYRPKVGTVCSNREPHQAHRWSIGADQFACLGVAEGCCSDPTCRCEPGECTCA